VPSEREAAINIRGYAELRLSRVGFGLSIGVEYAAGNLWIRYLISLFLLAISKFFAAIL
jgi:hypothetical protein